METPPDSSSLLPRPGQLIRPQQIDVCVATRGAGSGAQPDGETVPCGPPHYTHIFDQTRHGYDTVDIARR